MARINNLESPRGLAVEQARKAFSSGYEKLEESKLVGVRGR
jgi:hypothetical protein